jgi:hypothetical protein
MFFTTHLNACGQHSYPIVGMLRQMFAQRRCFQFHDLPLAVVAFNGL